MSLPTWTPAKELCSRLLQLIVPVTLSFWRGAPTARLVFAVDVELMFTSPPTPRAHTPPPWVSGGAPPGLATKALPCWVRNAVLTLAIEEATEPAVPAAKAPMVDGRSVIPPIVISPAQFCAHAPEEVISATTSALEPSRALFLILIVFI